jgi:cytochrome c oxidase subunit 2
VSGTLAARVASLAGGSGTFWLPSARSSFAGRVDDTFYLIFWVCVFFFLLILALAVYMLVKYRRRGDEPTPLESAHHNTTLELVWSGIPLLIVLGIFVMGFRGYVDMHTPPEDSYVVSVNAQKWAWSFTYPNGYEDPELHVPAGRPVKLVMTSQDVIHCLYVPDFRTKQDVVPGRYTTAWFRADEPGESRIFCAEYCGTKHSQMLSKVVVHEPAEFDAWMAKAADWIKDLPPAEAGAQVYRKKGCNQCHSVDGSGGVGPTFRAAFGARRRFADGSAGEMDENYVRESLLSPRARVVAGFDPVMPTFQGRLKENEIAVLIEYLRSLSQ